MSEKAYTLSGSVQIAVLLLATSFLFVAYLVRFGYGVLLPRMIEDLRLSHVEAGLAYSLFLFLYSLFSVISGRLFDRFGVKVISLLCYVYSIGTVLVGLSQNYYMLALGLAIAGLGSSSSWTPMVALVSLSLPNERRSRAIGMLEVGIRISHGTTGLIIPIIALTLGWRACWWIIASLLLVYGVIFQTLTRRLHFEMQKGRSVKYKEVLSSKRFWLIGASYFFMAFGSYSIITFLVDFLEQEVGIPYVEASAMVSLMGFVGIIGALAFSWLSDRVGRGTIITICDMLASATLVFFIFSIQNAAIKSFLMLITAVYGVFYGVWPIYAACAGDVFPDAVGTVVGLWTLLSGLSALTAPTLGGLMVDVTGSYVIALEASCLTYAFAAVIMILTSTLKKIS